VETEWLGWNIVVVVFLPVFAHVILLDEREVHMPGFFCLAHVVWKNVEDILPLLQNVDVDRNVRIESLKFWRVFWLEREVQSAPVDLIFMLDVLGFPARIFVSRVESCEHGPLEAHLVVTLYVDTCLTVSSGSRNFDVPAPMNRVVFVDVKGEIRDGLQSPSGVLLLEIFMDPEKRFLDVFDEPGTQIRSRQDGRVLGVEALCVGRVAVKNGEFANEDGVDFDGLVSLQKALHYLNKYGLRLFKEGVDVLSAQVDDGPRLDP